MADTKINDKGQVVVNGIVPGLPQKQPSPQSPTTNVTPPGTPSVLSLIQNPPMTAVAPVLGGGINIAGNPANGIVQAGAPTAPIIPQAFNAPVTAQVQTGLPNLPAGVQPFGQAPAGPALPDPNKDQEEIKNKLESGNTNLEDAGAVRETADTPTVPTATVDFTPTPGSGAADVGLPDLSGSSSIPDATKVDYDADAKAMKDLVAQYQKDSKAISDRYLQLIDSFSTDPNAQKLVDINLALGKSEDEIRKGLSDAGVPASVGLVSQLVHERDKALINDRDKLTALAEMRDKQYERIKDHDKEAAEQVARVFNTTYDLDSKLFDLKVKEGDRAQELADKAKAAKVDYVKNLLTTGGLAYTSDADLAKLAVQSGYPEASLLAAKKSLRNKTQVDAQQLENDKFSAETARINANRARVETKAVENLGGAYADIDAQLTKAEGDDGFVNTKTYGALLAKAKDQDLFAQSFGDRLNPDDPTAKAYRTQYEKQASVSGSASRSVNYTAASIPEDLDAAVRASIASALVNDVAWEDAYPRLSETFPNVDINTLTAMWKAAHGGNLY